MIVKTNKLSYIYEDFKNYPISYPIVYDERESLISKKKFERFRSLFLRKKKPKAKASGFFCF